MANSSSFVNTFVSNLREKWVNSEKDAFIPTAIFCYLISHQLNVWKSFWCRPAPASQHNKNCRTFRSCQMREPTTQIKWPTNRQVKKNHQAKRNESWSRRRATSWHFSRHVPMTHVAQEWFTLVLVILFDEALTPHMSMCQRPAQGVCFACLDSRQTMSFVQRRFASDLCSGEQVSAVRFPHFIRPRFHVRKSTFRSDAGFSTSTVFPWFFCFQKDYFFLPVSIYRSQLQFLPDKDRFWPIEDRRILFWHFPQKRKIPEQRISNSAIP
jgi:hypothetical protein